MVIKKLTPCLWNGREKNYSQKFPRTSIMSHGNKSLLFQLLNFIIAIKKPWKCFLNVPIHRTLKDLVNLSLRKFRLGKVIIWHKFDPISCCWQDYFTFFRHAFLPKVFVCLFRDSRFRLRLVLRFSFVRIRKTVDRSSRDDVLKRIFRKLFSTCKRLEEVPFTIRKCRYTFLFLNPILLYSED